MSENDRDVRTIVTNLAARVQALALQVQPYDLTTLASLVRDIKIALASMDSDEYYLADIAEEFTKLSALLDGIERNKSATGDTTIITLAKE